MSTKTKLNRRQAIGGTAALLASAAISPLPALAQSDAAAANAFYASGRYTYCDLKILAEYWKASPDINGTFDAKIAAGQKILNGIEDAMLEQLQDGARQWSASGRRCSFEDADNPAYTYEDAVKLAKLWGQGMTPYDAKLKVALNIEGGGNLWVRGELARAR